MTSLKMAFLATACAAAISLGVNSARADDGMNYYVSAFGGVAFAEPYETSFAGVLPGDNPLTAKYKTGFIVGGAIGVENLVMENTRTELEVSYFRFKPKSYVTSNGDVGANPSGHLSSLNVLINAWYDVDLGMAISPYIGGGVGIGFVSNKMSITNGGPGSFYSGSDVGFAFQVGTGFQFDVTETVALDVGYRFRGVLGTKPKTGPGAAIQGFSLIKGDDIFVHTIQGGISFKLPPM